jgi:hypothetical protein
MDLFGRKASAMLGEALAELHSVKSSLDLERTNRIAAQSLAESYRIRAEHAEELAKRLEEERAEAVRERLSTLTTMVEKLTANSIPRDEPNQLARVKESMKQLPSSPTVNPLRKAMIDSDLALIQALKANARTAVKSMPPVPPPITLPEEVELATVS